MDIRIISEEQKADINIKNEPFRLFSRIVPSYADGVWSYTLTPLPKESTMLFPDEGYDYDSMKENSVFVGAYEDKKCIGLCVLQTSMFRYMYISDLKVNADQRGKGVGKALIRRSAEIAKERGYIGLYTIGQDNNAAACLFYLGCGFRIGGLDTDVYNGTSQQGKSDIYFYLDF